MASFIPAGAKRISAAIHGYWDGGAEHAAPTETASFVPEDGATLDEQLIDWAWPIVRELDRYDCGGFEDSEPYPFKGGLCVVFHSIGTGLPIATLYIKAERPVLSFPAVDLSVRREDLPRIEEAA